MPLSQQNTSLAGGSADAIRHCVLACSLTQRLGRSTAKSILDRHESDGPLDLMDSRNNEMGCFIGEKSSVGSCQSQCVANVKSLMTLRTTTGNRLSKPAPIGERP
jgi:hypothetical protein